MNASVRLYAVAFSIATVSVLAITLTPGAVTQRLAGPVPYACDPVSRPCLRVVNDFVRADVSPLGTWTMGTTDGDPGTALDNDKNLLYGYVGGGGSDVGSSFVTVRVVGPQGPHDFVPRETADVLTQMQDGDERVVTVWRASLDYDVRVTETLRLVQNPFSGRKDLVDAEFEVVNMDPTTLEVGIRLLLDVKIGNTDGAPYFVPGIGTLTHETSFTATEVPAYWLAFEDPSYDPSRLRGLGLLSGEGLTGPDAFWIAYWPRIQREAWDYNLDPTRAVTSDSAVALLWQPTRLATGERRAVNTRYGIAANRGGHAFLAAPVEAGCDTTVVLSMFVSNFDIAPLTGGTATLRLPNGFTVAQGELDTKPFPDIAPGDTRSVAWHVRIADAVAGTFELGVTANFEGGIEHETTETITVHCVPSEPPTATATATTAGAARTPTAPPPLADLCPGLEGRVPPAAIAAALANPEKVYGWGLLANPNLPPSPVNPPRRWLTVTTINKPYNSISNPLVYKAGCL